MGAAVAVLALAAGLAIAIKGLPLLAEALAGRRIEAAVQARDGATLRRAASGAGGLAEIGRVLARLPTVELLALGDGLAAAAAEDESGAQVLAAIARVVERRDQALGRWTRVRERREGAAAAAVAAAAAPAGEARAVSVGDGGAVARAGAGEP